MMTEAQLQSKIVTWLKAKGLYVIKTAPGPGTPVGCPDVIGLIDGGGWVALEIKASPKARYQPLQQKTIAKLDGMFYSRRVDPTNWEAVKAELETLI